MHRQHDSDQDGVKPKSHSGWTTSAYRSGLVFKTQARACISPCLCASKITRCHMWQLNLCDDELTRKCYQMTRTLLRVRKKCRLHSEADASRWVRIRRRSDSPTSTHVPWRARNTTWRKEFSANRDLSYRRSPIIRDFHRGRTRFFVLANIFFTAQFSLFGSQFPLVGFS